jgi:cytochrome c oxidase subunit 2
MTPQAPNLGDYSKWWLPKDISSHGASVDGLIVALHVFMFILFVGWGIFFVYCLWKFSAKNNPKAHYVPVSGSISKGVEVAVVIIEAILLLVFSMPVWDTVKNGRPDEKDAVVVHVFAKQFEWYFQYPGADGKFGALNPKLIDDTNPLGLDRTGDGADDVVLTNKFVFPAEKPIIMYLRSRDVIHSFKMPVMRFTQDAIPGVEIPMWFQTRKGDDVAGVYDISCAQLCGVQHTSMRALAQIVPQAEFEKFRADPKGWQAAHPVDTSRPGEKKE